MAKSDLNLPGGGPYAVVASRITLFYERFPEGRIVTELVSRTPTDVTFRAAVYRTPADREPAATGWASEREGDGDVNAVACLENTETSAVGRALANLGFTAALQRPSAEEMAKVARARARVAEAAPSRRAAADAAVRADVRLLLGRAERAGLRPARSAAVRALLDRVDPPAGKLEEIERWLRRWLERRQAALVAPAAHGQDDDASPATTPTSTPPDRG